MPVARNNNRSRRQKVIDAIQKRILNGKLKPGDPLRQIPLSKQYNVSQSVVRESLQTLEQHGLVTSSTQVGFVVRTLDLHELVDAYQVRAVLEGLAARLCCRKASRDDVETLRDLAQQIHACSARTSRNELEYQFHQYFLTLSSNETLQRVSIGYRFVGNLVVTERDRDELLDEHLAIVDAVANNQPDEAERLARLHISRSAESIQKQGN